MNDAKRFGTLDRRAAVKELLRDRGDILLVTGLGSPTYDAFAAGDHDGNFYLWGAMGGAAMVGLGIALAQPKRPVVVLTGDGEQLMGLGALATVVTKRPANLTIAVVDNGHFGETGGQVSHSGLGLDLHRVAAAMGFVSAVELRDMAQVSEYRPQLQDLTAGPRCVTLRVAPGNAPRALPARDGVYLKQRFRAHLGFHVE
jgi:thiamine pyrophosphate-dependent acetolactate synthase large subunit-like protein